LLELKSLKDHDLKYVALSWTWGPPSVTTKLITVHDERHSIWPSLHEALLALRSPEDAQHFWIDAICINQMTSQEKGTQIPLMTDIYTSAEQVFV
jgi:hypothetical protein